MMRRLREVNMPVGDLPDKHNSDDFDKVSHEAMQIVHDEPELLRVALCDEQQHTKRVPSGPHPPAMLLVLVISQQVKLVETACFRLTSCLQSEGPNAPLVVLLELGLVFVGPAHRDGLIERH